MTAQPAGSIIRDTVNGLADSLGRERAVDLYDKWRARLAGDRPLMHESEAECGFESGMRKRFSRTERERLFDLHRQRCYLCRQPIQVGEAWELEHVIPWELTRPAHVACHKAKTAEDIRGIRKADRQRQKHRGIKASTGRPLPGTRASGLRKRMNGDVERWPT